MAVWAKSDYIFWMIRAAIGKSVNMVTLEKWAAFGLKRRIALTTFAFSFRALNNIQL